MIDLITARSGHPVLRKSGRLLGSSFDPMKEASAWAEKAAGTLEPSMSAFILGAGSGYHVSALARLRPNCPMIVIDCDEELVREASRLAEWPIQVASAVAGLGDDPIATVSAALFANPAVQDALGGRFAIVKHGPSFVMAPDFFNAADCALLARDKIAWLAQLKTRPELCALLDPEAIRSLGEEPVSIKTLQKLFKPQADRSRERRLWQILEELVQ